MANTGDIVKMTTLMRFLDTDCYLVEYREVECQNDLIVVEASLAEAYYTRISSVLAPIVSASLDFISVTCDNVSDGVSFGVYAGSAGGSVPGECLPVFTNYVVKQNRSTKVTRNGRKAIPGVPESLQTNGISNLPLADRQAIMEFFSDDDSYDIGDPLYETVWLYNIIIGRTKDANGVYQIDLSKKNLVASATFEQRLSTQNSRKR